MLLAAHLNGHLLQRISVSGKVYCGKCSLPDDPATEIYMYLNLYLDLYLHLPKRKSVSAFFFGPEAPPSDMIIVVC